MGEMDARDALDGVTSWSLARWADDGDAFTVHRLVQKITRERLPSDQKDNTLDSALDVLNAGLPSPEWDEKGWRRWERLAPHVRALLHHLKGSSIELDATVMMHKYGLWLSNRAPYPEAQP